MIVPSPDMLRNILCGVGCEPGRVDRALPVLLGNDDVTPAPPEPMLPSKRLCEQLDISTTTLWRLQPPCHLVGARKRYRLSEVLSFLEQRRSIRSGGGAT